MGSVKDIEAFERKLNPIYDALQCRNYKNGLKLIDVQLKKYKGNQTLLALRAYALSGSGKPTEAQQILAQLTADGPESEHIANLMTMSYKTLGQPNKIVEVYIAASARSPSDIDIALGLFNAYVRVFDFAKQQQLALKLGKAVPPNMPQADQFGWWAVSAVALQGKSALSKRTTAFLPPQKLMELAATMAERQAAKSSKFTYEMLLLQLDILQGLGRASEAVAKIENAPQDVIPMDADRLHLKAAALIRSSDLASAATLYKDASLANPDDWILWSLYLDCILPGSVSEEPLGGGGSSSRFPVGVVGGLADVWDRESGNDAWKLLAGNQTSADVSAAFEKAEQVLEELQTKAASKSENSANTASTNRGGSCRGIAVAKPELALRRLRFNLPDAENTLASAIADSLPLVFHSFSCIADLQTYLSALKSDSAREFVYHKAQELVRISVEQDGSNSSSQGHSSRVKTLQRHVNLFKLGEELGKDRPSSMEDALEHAKGLVGLYTKYLDLSDGLDPKDRGYGEDLLAIATGSLIRAHTLQSSSNSSQKHHVLLLAILMLEAAQIKRQVSAPLRLSSTALLGLLGASKSASRHFTALDIKGVLHSTLTGHWLVPALLSTANYNELAKWNAGVINVHNMQVIEAGDALIDAYKYGTYSKAPEFVEFLQLLQDAYTFALAKEENQHHTFALDDSNVQKASDTLRKAADTVLQAAKEDELSPLTIASSGRLRFIDDLGTRPCWFPPSARPARFAVADWWEQQTIAGGDGKHMKPGCECWWTAVGASSSNSSQEAVQWRQELTNAVQRRGMLPELLSLALSEKVLGEEEVKRMQKEVEGFDALFSKQQGGDDVVHKVEHLTSLLMKTAYELHNSIDKTLSNGSSGDLSSLNSSFTELELALQHVLKVCIDRLNVGQELPLLLLPANSGVALTAALVNEELVWTLGCLQVWHTLLKSAEKRNANMASVFSSVSSKISTVASSVSTSLTALKSALDDIVAIDVPSRVDSVLQVLVEEHHGDVFWSFEPLFEPHVVLGNMFTDQQDTARRLQSSVSVLLKGLSAFN